MSTPSKEAALAVEEIMFSCVERKPEGVKFEVKKAEHIVQSAIDFSRANNETRYMREWHKGFGAAIEAHEQNQSRTAAPTASEQEIARRAADTICGYAHILPEYKYEISRQVLSAVTKATEPAVSALREIEASSFNEGWIADVVVSALAHYRAATKQQPANIPCVKCGYDIAPQPEKQEPWTSKVHPERSDQFIFRFGTSSLVATESEREVFQKIWDAHNSTLAQQKGPEKSGPVDKQD